MHDGTEVGPVDHLERAHIGVAVALSILSIVVTFQPAYAAIARDGKFGCAQRHHIP